MKLFGIDVSRWQGNFDFAKAKAEGVRFVIAKCGGGDDGLYRDMKFEDNYKAAKEQGLGVGTYFFGHAANTAEALQEAQYCASLLGGKELDYPVFYDVEDSRMQVGKDALTEIVKTFCNAMENLGFWCGFYTNLNWYTYYLNGAELAERYSFWLATWDRKMPDLPGVQMWQFGGSTNYIRTNRVAGVVCDQNYCFTDYPTLIKTRGKNGYKAPATETAASKPETKPETKPAQPTKPAQSTKPAASKATTFKKKDRVRVNKDGVVYGTDQEFAPWVYERVYIISEISGNRVVLVDDDGVVIGAIDKKYLRKA